jgi:hypothetical protein
MHSAFRFFFLSPSLQSVPQCAQDFMPLNSASATQSPSQFNESMVT